MLTEITRPYEFLARWDTKTGTLSGSHVGFSTIILRDGVFVTEQINPVQPVGAAGFPLADILNILQIDAIKAMDVAKAELVVEKAAHKAAKDELALLKSKKL